MVERVAVFIDYQNVYKGARKAFCPTSRNHADGQVHPRRLALKLKGVGDDSRVLVGVWVYRGMPSSRHDRKGFAAADRQIGLWRHQAAVFPVHRPINYRDPQRPREKGIDVRIAVDMVSMAMTNHYDTCVLFSGDTDLLPALELIASMEGRTPEVAAWRSPAGEDSRLRFDKKLGLPPLRCHVLDQRDYAHVHDPTDYTQKRRRR